MKILIVYTTNMGSVKKSAELLQAKFTDADVIDLKSEQAIDLHSYDTVILGGSIYAGRTQKALSEFVQNNLQELLSKRIGIFVNSAEKEEKGIQQLKAAFPEKLTNKAIALGCFGDEIDLNKCNFFTKLLVKLKGVKESYSNISEEEISKFAAKIK